MVEQVAADPAAPGAKAALAFQLQALLNADTRLGSELAELMQAPERPGGSSSATAGGARSITIGGNVSGSQIVAGDWNRVQNVRVRDDASAVDPRALVDALADLQAALGQANLQPSDRMVAQTAAGNAALEGVKDGQVNADVVAQNVERIGKTLKNANTAIQEGSSLWSSVQNIATTLGPLVGGARVVATWFGVPIPF
jgi:hypothetical protein